MPTADDADTGRAGPWLRRALRNWGAAFAFWTVPGLLDAAQYYVNAANQGRGMAWSEAVLRGAPKWWLWALLTPLIWEAGRRFPLERERWRRALLVHVPAAVVVTTLHLALSAAAFYLQFGRTQEATYPQVVARYLMTVFALDFVGYWAILGASATVRYYRMFREREIAATRLQASLAEARLHALQMQLHPHFLFNTLHAASALVLEGSRERSIRMLSLLSDLLRLALVRSDQQVTLAEELEFLEPYLEIERMRFEERLSVRVDVDPEVLDAQVPTFLLQPLVENAVRHGIARQTRPGSIALTARRRGPRLELRVRDTGPGLRGGRPTPGIGLSNTRARLEQLHGDDFRLELADHPAGGAEVVVDLPFRAAAGGTAPSTAVAEYA